MAIDKIPGAGLETTGTASVNTFLRGDNAWAGTITSGTAVASTSGTSIDFTGIPATAKRVTVMFNGVSTNGSSVLTIRLGTVSGIVATGYGGTYWQSNTGNAAISTGFTIGASNAASIFCHGVAQFVLLESNTWAGNVNLGRVGGIDFVLVGGSVALGGVLDRVRITTNNGTDVFDAGSINVMWEG